jgi:hypothetical protein
MSALRVTSIWLWAIINLLSELSVNINRFLKQLLTTVLLLWSVSGFASGNYSGPDRDDNGNIVPTPKGDACVEPTADMRANHMKYLLHKRDKTMHQGIRTSKHSLVACINCHATPGEDGKIARVTDEQHFCASCHKAASVKLDCFECHADRPVSAFSQNQQPSIDPVGTNPDSTLSDSLKPQAAISGTVE